jgi:hypothetical protein
MIFPKLARFTDVALLLLRIMFGIVFMTSGWKHLQDPEARSKSIGMSKGFTIFLGAAVRRKYRSDLWRSRATRGHRFDIDNARGDPEEDFRLANRLLG